MAGRFRLVLLAYLSHSSVTYPLRWIGPMVIIIITSAITTTATRNRMMKTARTTYLFDVSASSASSTASSAFPTNFSSSTTTTNNGGGGAGSQSSSPHNTFEQHPFSSILPAINSAMRYDPPFPSPLNSLPLPPPTHHLHGSIPRTPT